MKVFALIGNIFFFPFSVNTISEGSLCAEKQTGRHKSCLQCRKMAEIYQVYQVSLTHCRLNRLFPHKILEWFNFNFRYVLLWDLHIPREKWLKHSAASDLGLHCLPITLLWVSRLQWVKLMSFWHYLERHSLLGILFWMKIFYSDWPYHQKSYVFSVFVFVLKYVP